VRFTSPRAALMAAAAFFVAAVAVLVVAALVTPLLGIVLLAGAGVAGVALVARSRSPSAVDPGRRRFLAALGVAGAGAAMAGLPAARVVRELVAPDARDDVWASARSLGAGPLGAILRGYHPGRSGDLQLVLKPFNTSNYPHESRSLEPRDPRSSHALVWAYTDRIPFVIYAPGIVESQDHEELVTLADLAPTTATLMGFDGFGAPDGRPMPGIATPAEPPKVVVTVAIDGGGWNVLTHWSEAWPVIKDLMRRGAVYRNGWMGSFPNVTASAHATMGTGAFPRTHGISGHHIRHEGGIERAFGDLGAADPGFILLPTLADAWSEETGDGAWVGEVGHQVWHLGMLGGGGRRPMGDLPVAVYFDEERSDWASQNPDLYRLPGGVPPRTLLSDYLREYFGDERGEEIDREAGQAVCCDPPIVRHQGDLMEMMFREEPIGESGHTDLLYVSFKTPDYAGHASNMLSERERISLEAVDRELGRLVRILERRFRPGEYVLIVTADHGQVPLVDDAGGVRLDPIELTRDLEGRFWSAGRPLVESVRPSEVFFDDAALRSGEVDLDERAADLLGYRYGENVGPHTPRDAIQRDRLDRRQFAAVLPGPFVEALTEADVRSAGEGRFPHTDPGMPSPVR
jgi:hypothetical protein